MAKVRSPNARPNTRAGKTVPTRALYENCPKDISTKEPYAPGKGLVSSAKVSKTARYIRRPDRQPASEGRGPIDLSAEFKATLNQSRQSILEQSCSRLDQIEQCLLRNLKDAADDFDKKRQTAQELEEPIFEPIGMERLTIEDNHKGAGPDRIKKVLLGTNMEEFRNIASKSDRALEALWKEWTFVQEDILTLGVTVLGSEAMDFASLQGCRSMQTKLEASIEAFSKHKGSTTAVKERSDELIGQIDHVINDTIKKSRDQEKKFRLGLNKCTREIKNCLHSLMDGSA